MITSRRITATLDKNPLKLIVKSGGQSRKPTGKASGIVADLTIWNKFVHKESGYSVVIEDDGRVAHGYMLNQTEKIVSDVWLYNRCESPSEPEWTNPENMPFANSASFTDNEYKFTPINKISDMDVFWPINERQLHRADI
ncbi:hypothetical protein O5O45_31850 [Hahella aquimaris]|uniref:hypothetical protein n=1 Tax=Hahella sp. HNIBRBA332 TaxID=3015983 RepID=UPI00273BB5EC|nr:hypothetical protein [Hahella sp. HNIBRBA332]WLQ14314.1 hypothetical protein O5O45_31850 [Hahella sp. HNIBRBA332]